MTTDESPEDQHPSQEAPEAPSLGSNDVLLEALRGAVRAMEGSLSITLCIGGGVIYGSLISPASWIEGCSAQLEEAKAGLGQTLQDILEQVTGGDVSRAGSGYVHLRQATYLNGSLSMDFPLWRGAIDQISGWSLGEGPRGGLATG